MPGWLWSPQLWFSRPKNLCSLNDFSGLNSLNGLNDLNSLISSKTLLILMVRWSLAPKWPTLVHFWGMDHQNSNVLLILAPFLSEAGEDSRCYFFENWFMKLKIYDLLKPLGTITQQNYWSFYLSEPFQKARFNMRHPVIPLLVIGQKFWKLVLQCSWKTYTLKQCEWSRL